MSEILSAEEIGAASRLLIGEATTARGVAAVVALVDSHEALRSLADLYLRTLKMLGHQLGETREVREA